MSGREIAQMICGARASERHVVCCGIYIRFDEEPRLPGGVGFDSEGLAGSTFASMRSHGGSVGRSGSGRSGQTLTASTTRLRGLRHNMSGVVIFSQ